MQIIVSRDGTVLDARDCVVLDCDDAMTDYVTDEMGDSDRFDFVISMGGRNVSSIVMLLELIKKGV